MGNTYYAETGSNRRMLLFLFPQIQVMKIENPGSMDISIAIARSQLLKKIHVSKLDIIRRVYMITEPNEKTILIKIIINDLVSEIDM